MKVIVLAVAALLCTSCASRESVEVPHDRLAAAAGEQHGFEPPEAFLMFHASGVGWLERHPTGGLAFAVWEDGQLVRAAGLDDPGEYSCARGYISPQDHAKLIEAVRNALLRVPEDSCLPFDSNGYVLTYLGARNCVERYEWIGNNGEPLGSWGEPLGTESVLHRLASLASSMNLNRSDALDYAPLLHETDWGCDKQSNRAVSSQTQGVD